MTPMRPKALSVYLLFFLSGAAGLGYQMVWLRMFAAGLGHETPAMLAVASAFLGGLAIGAWALDRRVSLSSNAVRWYGGLEIWIGVTGAVSALTVPLVNQLALTLAGPSPPTAQQWLVTFALPFLTLLPTTAAMGATLPAMERLLSPLSTDGRCVGALYAANTFGAVAGTLGCVFVLMPAVGFRASLTTLATANVFCGIAALIIFRAGVQGSAMLPNRDRRNRLSSLQFPVALNVLRVSPFRIHITLFCTGLLGIGFEIVGVRVLAQVLENTIYSYAAALSVFLVGTAFGASLYQRFWKQREFRSTLAALLSGVGLSCLLCTGLLVYALPVYRFGRGVFGDSLNGVLAAEMIVAALAFGVPTVLMGATFSHLVQGARRKDGGVGRAGGINTFGCAMAGLFIVIVMPAVGTKWTLIFLSTAYVLLLPRWNGLSWRWVTFPLAIGFATLADLRIVEKPDGAQIAAYEEGVMASVAVVRTADGHRSLRVNNRLQMGGTAAALAERRQAHIPLLLHTNATSALFLGPGTGITLGAANAYPGLVADGVELVPEVLDVMHFFQPENEGPLPKQGGRLYPADARRFVRTTTNRYDVIVADLFHPAHDGAGFLYTREHFQAVRERLRPGGLFCQWLPLHQLDEVVLKSIVRTFLETFSDSRAFLLHFNVDIPALALVGTPDPQRLPQDWFDKRLANAELRTRLRGVGLERAINLPGCFAADATALKRFASDAPISTDNHPVILFAAPRFTVRRDVPPHELLLSFLEKCRPGLTELKASGLVQGDDGFATTLAEFIAARDVYLKGLVEEGSGRLTEAIEAYLQSARLSLQFTSGYARCVTIIQVMAGTNRERAKKLFQRLEEAQPAQPLGRRILGPIFEDRATGE